jgi:hypothetical protein
MALSQRIEVNSTGAFATYWVVEVLHFDLKAGVSQCTVNGYLDQPSFAAAKNPMANRGYNAPTPGSFATLTGSQMVATVQAFVQTQPEFVGSTPVS